MIQRTITINGVRFFLPSSFTPTRERVYKGEYTTCVGSTNADLVGWKYSDMDLTWELLTPEMVNALIALPGQFPITFEDMDGEHTEEVRAISNAGIGMRETWPDGTVVWHDCKLSISFISEAH